MGRQAAEFQTTDGKKGLGNTLASTAVPGALDGKGGSAKESRPLRMTGQERREQLLDVGREIFAERGFEGASIEEIAKRADVSKPVVYEHFGGKEGLYAVVVDREMKSLLTRITDSLQATHPKAMLEQAATALLTYIEDEQAGFRILIRHSPVASTTGTFASLIGDIASQVEYIFRSEFKRLDYDPNLAALYSQALVGMVALVGQWWLETRKPSRDRVAAHLVNLAWNGLGNLEHNPRLDGGKKRDGAAKDARKPKKRKVRTA